MNAKIESAINELVAALRDSSPADTTTFNLFVNCEGHRVEIHKRTGEDLRSAGISMRNLRGLFIK